MNRIEVDGIRLEEENEVIIKLDGKNYQFPKKIKSSHINLHDFVLVQDEPLDSSFLVTKYLASSAVSMNQMFNGEGDFFGLHKKVFASGLKGMDARKFLHHLYNVNEASQGRGILYDANGNLIEGLDLKVYADRLNHRCCSYVNGLFKKSKKGEQKGFRGLDLVIITGYKNGKPIFSRTPLLPCLENACFADVTLESLNSQGFPTKKAPTNKFEDGKTAYFRSPIENAVTWFNAGSHGASFFCDNYPDGRVDSMGIFASVDVEREGEAGRR